MQPAAIPKTELSKKNKNQKEITRTLDFSKKKVFVEVPNAEKHQPVESQNHPLWVLSG